MFSSIIEFIENFYDLKRAEFIMTEGPGFEKALDTDATLVI